jgi:hypothetical protein
MLESKRNRTSEHFASGANVGRNLGGFRPPIDAKAVERKTMHEIFKLDYQSVCKNEWILRLVEKGIQTFLSVFREDGSALWSPATHRHLNGKPRNRLSRYRAWQLLLDVDRTLSVKDTRFWRETIPGLVGINTDLWPREGQQRRAMCTGLVAEARHANADLLFCELGTGLATQKITTNPRKYSQVHLNWDELRALFDESPSSLAIYQHGRRASWTAITAEYRAALTDRECTILQLSAGRARIVLALKARHAELIRSACRVISAEFQRLRVYEENGILVAVAAA